MQPLYEKYRPRDWDNLIGQTKCRQKIELLRKRGLAGRVYWITGQSGTGKTTAARLIAAEVGDDWAVIEIDGADLTLDRIRQYEEMCRMKPLGRGQHVFIVNEAHSLRSPVIRRLNTTFETECVQRNSTWIFTTTVDGHESLFDGEIEASPFMSRVHELPLSRRDLTKPFAERAKEIAMAEGLDGRPVEEYVKLARKRRNNFRAMLCDIEDGVMVMAEE